MRPPISKIFPEATRFDPPYRKTDNLAPNVGFMKAQPHDYGMVGLFSHAPRIKRR